MLVDPRQHAQQRGLAGPVGADQADAVAVLDVEDQIGQRPHMDAIGLVTRLISLQRKCQHQFSQRPIAGLVDRKFDRDVAQAEIGHARPSMRCAAGT